jgi:hypothetical protein
MPEKFHYVVGYTGNTAPVVTIFRPLSKKDLISWHALKLLKMFKLQ